MERESTIETTLGGWYEKLPHLPETARHWLADNVWWMVLVAVVIGGFAIIGVMVPLLLVGALFSGFGGVIGAAIGGLLILVAILWLLLAIVSLVLLAMAIQPLKRHDKRGWRLVLWVLLINVAAVVIKVMFDFEPMSFLFGLLMLGISGYFLFEIRERFMAIAEPLAMQPGPEAKPQQ